MKKYLPIGSVIRIQNNKKKLMIYGRRQTSKKNGQEYDYIACPYPEGNISEEYSFVLNEEIIEEVIFEGYIDDEEDEFNNYLIDFDEDNLKDKENNGVS